MTVGTETATTAAGGPLIRGGMEVTRQQAHIVDHVLDHAMTVADAGAGSGKTRTTVATVLEILERRPDVTLDRFVLITFTNKAADELRRRLEAALAGRQAEAERAGDAAARRRWADCRERLNNAYVGTIHGFCRLVLKTFGYGALVARESDMDFTTGMLYEATEDAMEEAFAADPAHPLRTALSRDVRLYELADGIRTVYQHLRNRGLSAAKVAARTAAQDEDRGKPVRRAVADLVARVDELYGEKKRQRQKVDAADLLARTADLLADESEPGIVAKLARRYRWLFIDEFQDTDQVQKRIVDRLKSELDGVLLVGDVKQSIYRFRGAGLHLGAIARENKVDVLPLNISRRPTRKLLDVQNALFKSVAETYPELDQPLEPYEGTIEPKSPVPPLVYLHAGKWANAGDRAAATADHIRSLVGQPLDLPDGGRRPIEPGDIALLFRSNYWLDQYEQLLRGHLSGSGIEVRKEAGGQFYRRPEVVAAYRLLRLLLDYPDDVVLSQALATPYLRARTEDSSGRQQELLQYGRRDGHPLTDWFTARHPDLAAALRDLRARVRGDTVPEVLGRAYERLGVLEYHRSRGEADEADNLEHLREVARNLMNSEQALTLRTFVNWLQTALLAAFDEPDAAEAADGEAESSGRPPPYVRMMTVHKSKGLEFPVVIVPEVQAPVNHADESGDFMADEEWGLDIALPLSDGESSASPRFGSLTGRDAEANRREAMRVFYVAVTRAQNAVVLVGSGPRTSNAPGDQWYSWKDEVRRAMPRLLGLGARVI